MTEINTLKFIPIYSYRAVHFHFIKKVFRKYSIWKLQIETWNQCNSKLWTTCLCVRERLWTSISLLPLTEVRFSKFVVLRLAGSSCPPFTFHISLPSPWNHIQMLSWARRSASCVQFPPSTGTWHFPLENIIKLKKLSAAVSLHKSCGPLGRTVALRVFSIF